MDGNERMSESEMSFAVNENRNLSSHRMHHSMSAAAHQCMEYIDTNTMQASGVESSRNSMHNESSNRTIENVRFDLRINFIFLACRIDRTMVAKAHRRIAYTDTNYMRASAVENERHLMHNESSNKTTVEPQVFARLSTDVDCSSIRARRWSRRVGTYVYTCLTRVSMHGNDQSMQADEWKYLQLFQVPVARPANSSSRRRTLTWPKINLTFILPASLCMRWAALRAL